MVLDRSQLVGVGVGLAGAAFLGYCVYFDHKRRSAPDFQQKLKARRDAKRRRNAPGGGGGASGGGGGLPNFGNQTDMQAFFMQEVQLGEELMNAGNLEEGVEHMSNAVTLCGQPQALLQILQGTLPPEAFRLLVAKIPEAQQRMRAAAAAAGGLVVEEEEDDNLVVLGSTNNSAPSTAPTDASTPPTLKEDDIE